MDLDKTYKKRKTKVQEQMDFSLSISNNNLIKFGKEIEPALYKLETFLFDLPLSLLMNGKFVPLKEDL